MGLPLRTALFWLGTARGQIATLLVAMLLVLPALHTRFVLDDAVLLLQARTDPGVPGLRHRPLELFTFTTGDADDNRALMEHGVLLPWWSHPQLKVALFRPVASLTHLLDNALWPTSPLAMYAHNLLWHLLLLGAAWIAYRRLSRHSTCLAGLAFALYALDDARGAPVSWISNRNALIATALALPVLWLHVDARTRRSWPRIWWAAGLLTVAMLAGEIAIAVLGYVLAYACTLDRGSLRQRVATLLPYGLVVLVWRLAYQWFDFGAFGSGAYRDPGREPLAFLSAMAENLPILLASQLSVPMSDWAFWGGPSQRPWLVAFALSCLAGVVWLAIPAVKRSPHARFWGLGAVLACIPSAASLPGERMLIGVGLGGAGLLAEVLAHHFAPSPGTETPRPTGARHTGVCSLVFLHLVAAPLGLPARAGSMATLGEALEQADRSLPTSPEVSDKTVVILQAPLDVFASYVQVQRAVMGEPRPQRVHWLATANSPLHVERLGSRSLRLQPTEGYLHTPLERHYRAPRYQLASGAKVDLGDLRVRVETTTEDGRPHAVRFDFAEDLESARYLWSSWHHGRYWALAPPKVGASLRLPATDLARILVEHLAVRHGIVRSTTPPWSNGRQTGAGADASELPGATAPPPSIEDQPPVQ